MPEETIDIQYVGDYPGTIETKEYIPGNIYKVSKDLADSLLKTGQFRKVGGGEKL